MVEKRTLEKPRYRLYFYLIPLYLTLLCIEAFFYLAFPYNRLVAGLVCILSFGLIPMIPLITKVEPRRSSAHGLVSALHFISPSASKVLGFDGGLLHCRLEN